jgi:hypothetical protein
MFYDLQRMDLAGWHPREIPDAMLTNPAMQKQQSHTLPPLEQWYIMLLHNGVLPGAISGRPGSAYTKALIDDARSKIPRLRDLTEMAALPFEYPKLAAVISASLSGGEFGEALERARKRTVEGPQPTAKPLPPPTDLSARPMVSDRRFRK